MIKKFISYYKPYKKMFYQDMAASFVMSIIGMVYPIITRVMLNDFVPNRKLDLIIFFGILLFVLYFVKMLLKYFVQYYGHYMGIRMQAQMRRDMFRQLERLPYRYFDDHETGKIMTRMTNDLMDVSELAHHGPENVFICGIMVLGSFIYLGTINVSLTLIIFCCVPFLFLIVLKMGKRMDDAFMESRISTGEINAAVESSITGIRVTKAYNNAEKELDKFEVGNGHFVEAKRKAYKAMGQFSGMTGFVTDCFYAVVLLAGGLFLYNGAISFGDYSAFIVSVSLFINPLMHLIEFVEMYENGLTGFRRFQEILDEEGEKDKEGAIDIKDVRGDIEFKDVSFHYNENKEVLDHISFFLKRGSTLALVGPSGGGKTTICHLLPRFYPDYQGSILVDGQDISDVTLASLRDNIGIVQQDVFLFNGTIFENILYGRLDATYEEVIEASKKASIYDYVMSLPDGFDTVIGERGVKLSGGQKQRLSIARVFLKDPKILILDEATSALDNTTEMLIQKSLDELSVGRTVIVVAHRLSTIRNADEIAVITDGRICEFGSHNELMAKDGAYAALYKQQFRSE